MRCPRCNAESEVLDTRKADGGHLVRRRHKCFNDHVFTTVQIHQPVFCSAKPRQRDFLQTVNRRASVWRRNDQIRRSLRSGEKGTEIAERMGVSTSLVSLVKRQHTA